MVTLDELQQSEVLPKDNHIGRNWNLEMICCVNGIQVSKGNMADMHWTFAEIIQRASYGVDLYPGDVIGSGTVGTGCFLELNGTEKLRIRIFRSSGYNPEILLKWKLNDSAQ
ncbi:MAG: fumarylacetoacetate hydrolase family protein [Cyclobacteriaceae bacterium]